MCKGHTNGIRSLVFTENGNYLLSGSVGVMLRVWDVENRKFLTMIKGHIKYVNSISRVG